MRCTLSSRRALLIAVSLCAILSIAGCGRWVKPQIEVQTVEVPVAQYVPLEPDLLTHREPTPLPTPECKDGQASVSCVSQVLDWIEEQWCVVVRSHNCDKALIRCTQPTADGKRPDAGAVMRCITKAGANQCSARCG